MCSAAIRGAPAATVRGGAAAGTDRPGAERRNYRGLYSVLPGSNCPVGGYRARTVDDRRVGVPGPAGGLRK